MAITVTMPQMGESVVEGTIERWLVAPGEAVEKDQTLCEVTTDKVDAEIPAPEAGVITRLLVAEGTTVEVGAELAEIDPAATPSATRAEKAPPAPASAPAPASPREAPVAPVAATAPREETDDAHRVSPLARRLAEEHGIPLAQVEPADGLRVTREDVLSHLGQRPRAAAPESTAASKPATAAAPVGAAAPPAPRTPAASAAAAPGTLGDFLSRMRVPTYRPSESDNVIPFTTIRKRIAEHMVVSKIVSPHVGTVAEVDLARVVALRDRTKAEFEREHGFRLTYLPFIVQAVVRALRQVPRMNAAVVDQQIVERDGIHIGVAVETERGLLVPVVRDADRYSLTGIAAAIQDLATRARDREITADELHGGTFTVTNPGREGNLYGFAVINQPQVGILRTGEVKKRPVVVERDGEDALAIRPMMYLALSYDHRIIDGVTGNSFLYRVARTLEAGEFEV